MVGNCEVKTVFACLGENDGEGVGGKVLELVDIEIERATVGDVGNVAAAHGGQLDFGDEEGAKNTGIVFSNEAFAEVDDKDFTFVHDFANVETRLRLADNIADDRVGGKSTNFV